MQSRVNKVIEPITVVVINGPEYYTVQLIEGDLIKRERCDLVVEKGAERYHIPDKTMEVIKTVPMPTLEVKVYSGSSDGQINIIIEDGELFSNEEIAAKVKEAIDKYKLVPQKKVTT